MKSSAWAALLLAMACGGKTLEDPGGTEIEPRGDGEPREPAGGTDKQPPPPVGATGGYGAGGPVTGGSPAGGSVWVGGAAPVAGTGGYGGYVGGYGGYVGGYGGYVGGYGGYAGYGAYAGYGGQAPTTLEDAEYLYCQGVALMSMDNWSDALLTPSQIAALAWGSWFGHVYSAHGDWDVEFHLYADGGYSAYALSGMEPALYYGTDVDSELKVWQITGQSVRGASGWIDIIYGEPPDDYESGHQGWIDCMHLDSTQTRLRFEFWYGGEDGDPYGPFVYDLELF